MVNEIVDEMERLPVVRDCYEQWLVLQNKVDSYYHDSPRDRVPLSQQKEFRQIKNVVIRDDDIPMEDRMDAVNEMEQMAKDGDVYAQYLMGKLWRDGPLLIPNAVNAWCWFEQAARQGHLVAQYTLAKLYLSNDIEVRDTKQGMEWLHIAAEGGSRYAMYRLAKEYLRGEHIDRDPKKAVE